MQQIDSKCFRYADLSMVDRPIDLMIDKLPSGTLLHVEWRMVDAGEQKASQDMPYISHGKDGDQPLRMNVFVEILGGPHQGQGWYERFYLPLEIQKRCAKTLTAEQRIHCAIDVRTLKHMWLASHGLPLDTTEGLEQIDFAAFGGLRACVKIRNNCYQTKDKEQILSIVTDSVIDPADPICERVKNAGEILPQGCPATGFAPAESPAPAVLEPLCAPEVKGLIAILDKHFHGSEE